TKTVSMPVNRKAHQTQFPETPSVRTILATRLGVSVENVVATIDMPSSHHGIFLPAAKYCSEFFPAWRATTSPTSNEKSRYAPIMVQSTAASSIKPIPVRQCCYNSSRYFFPHNRSWPKYLFLQGLLIIIKNEPKCK